MLTNKLIKMQTQPFEDIDILTTTLSQFEANIDYLQLVLGANFEKLIISINAADAPGNVYEQNTLYLNQTIIPYNVKQEAMILIADSINEWKRRLFSLQDALTQKKYLLVNSNNDNPMRYVILLDSNSYFHYTSVKSAALIYTYWQLIEIMPTIKENKLSIELIN